jgi:hypothetical protein
VKKVCFSVCVTYASFFFFIHHENNVFFFFSQSVDSHIKEEDYDAAKDAVWIDRICETTMKGLADLKKPYKYVGTFRICV